MRISIAAMRAAGLSADQIVRVLEEQDAERRERERIKKRNQRARPQDGGDMGDSGDIGTNKEPSLFPEIQKQKRKKVSISPDWKLTDADRAYAVSKGWPERRIETEAERFRDYWLAGGKPMADWAATWRKWVTSPIQNTNGGHQHGRRHGSVLDAFDRLGEKLKQAGASDDYVPGTSGPRPLELDQKVRPANPKLISSR